MEGCLPDPERIIMQAHVDWGRASAQQLKRVSVDSDGGNMHSVNYADEAFGRCDIYRDPEKAPQAPIAGTSTVSMFNGKLQVAP